MPVSNPPNLWRPVQHQITLDNATTINFTPTENQMAEYIGITTDGSGMAQTLNILAQPGACPHTGYSITIECVNLSNAGDIPCVELGGTTLSSYTLDENLIGTWTNALGSGPANSIPINKNGYFIRFVWYSFGWNVDNTAYYNNATETIGYAGTYPPGLVSALPAATQGARAVVTDALGPVFGSPVAGSGGVTTTVFFDGTNWVVG